EEGPGLGTPPSHDPMKQGLARSDPATILACDGDAAPERLRREPRDMWRDNDIREREERIILSHRLSREDIEAGGCKVPSRERLEERGLIHELTARGVDQDGAGLHRRDRLTRHHADRLRRRGAMERNDVRAPEQRLLRRKFERHGRLWAACRV